MRSSTLILGPAYIKINHYHRSCIKLTTSLTENLSSEIDALSKQTNKQTHRQPIVAHALTLPCDGAYSYVTPKKRLC